MTVFLQKLKGICPDTTEKAMMKQYTTFRIGGAADFLCEPENEEQIRQIISLCREEGVSFMILGNGSNMLVSDAGIEGVVIRIAKKFRTCKREGNSLKAGAGILLSELANEAHKHGLSGLEFAGGIPGTLGGAIYMNAGAYGGEISDTLKEVQYLDADGEFHTLEVEPEMFGYRKSPFVGNNRVILSGVFELEEDNPEEIRERMRDFQTRRAEKQPLTMPSAGSVFKRPEGHFAGALVEQAGLKGYQIGGARVSEKHAGFIVNCGDATARDVLNLIAYIQKVVREKYQVELEPEVRLIGRE